MIFKQLTSRKIPAPATVTLGMNSALPLDLSLRMYTAQIWDSFNVQAHMTLGSVILALAAFYLKIFQDAQSTI